MQQQIKVIATAFALCGFAVALISAMIAGEAAAVAIARGLLALCICYVVGLAGACCLAHAIEEHLGKYRQAHPVPAVDVNEQNVDNSVDEMTSAARVAVQGAAVEAGPVGVPVANRQAVARGV